MNAPIKDLDRALDLTVLRMNLPGCRLDENESLACVNEPFLHLLELPDDAVTGQPLRAVFPDVPSPLPPRSVASIRRRDGSSVDLELMELLRGNSQHRILLIRDLTEQRRLEKDREALTGRLLQVQEDERREISSLLHDQMGQILTLIRLELQGIRPRDEESQSHVESCTQHVLALLETVRGLARSLRPPILDDMPIEDALEDLTSEFQRSTEFHIQFTCTGHSKERLCRDRQTSLYRILQEALQNAVRHSGGSQVKVSCRFTSEGASLTVCDDGCGFPAEGLHSSEALGLLGIRERLAQCGGFLRISSQTESGSEIEAFMPYE